MLGVHVNGAYHCCRCVLPSMIREKRGKIVNVSSIWGITGRFLRGALFHRQGGDHRADQSAGQRGGAVGIQVNCVAPGVVDTDMLAGFDETARGR